MRTLQPKEPFPPSSAFSSRARVLSDMSAGYIAAGLSAVFNGNYFIEKPLIYHTYQ
jgi:hypothetical protein